MVRFIKVVDALDKITDCIPVISLVKNISIIAYQRIHKVNKVANPVKAEVSWVDDLKIHALSKDAFIAGIAAIPIVGNFTCLVAYSFKLADRTNYLPKATNAFSWGWKKHGYEVAALYLARNRNLSEEKLRGALECAIVLGKEEIFKLISESRSDWSSDTLKECLKCAKTLEIAESILEEFSGKLTDKDAGSIVAYFAADVYIEDRSEIIDLLLRTYPNVDKDQIGLAIENAAEKSSLNTIRLLFGHLGQSIDEKHMGNALRKAANIGSKDIIEYLLQIAPNLVKSHLEEILEITARCEHKVIFNWLLITHEKDITSTTIGKVLKSLTRRFCLLEKLYCHEKGDWRLLIEELIEKYVDPNFPAKDLEPAIEEATHHDLSLLLFKYYLNQFTQLQPKNLQKILNEAVFTYGKFDAKKSHERISILFNQHWNQVAELIQEKFPSMKAQDILE